MTSRAGDLGQGRGGCGQRRVFRRTFDFRFRHVEHAALVALPRTGLRCCDGPGVTEDSSGLWSGKAWATGKSVSVRHWGRVMEAMIAICSVVDFSVVDVSPTSESWVEVDRDGIDGAGEVVSHGGDGNIDTVSP
jgi:hypothetical protein